MPSSRASSIPYVISVVTQIQPRSILDVGVGFGKWGYLFREYTDIVKSETDFNRYRKDGWKIRIEGIEVFQDYVHQGHHFIYDKLHIGNVVDILPNIGKFDTIFFGDILEHLGLEDGKAILQIAMGHCNKCVILTTPKFETNQGNLCNNPLERHLSLWTKKDFHDVAPCTITLSDKATYVVVFPTLSSDTFKPNFKHLRSAPRWLIAMKDFLRRVKKRLGL